MSGGAGSGNTAVTGGSARSLHLAVPWPILAILLVFCAAIGVGVVILAQHAGTSRVQFAAPGPVGSLQFLLLTGGQIFVGTLESTDRGTVVLSDVFSVQAAPNPGTAGTAQPAPGQPAPGRVAQLVRRKDADWHAPDRLAVPIDRIMLMETVGRESLVTKLVAEARAGRS